MGGVPAARSVRSARDASDACALRDSRRRPARRIDCRGGAARRRGIRGDRRARRIPRARRAEIRGSRDQPDATRRRAAVAGGRIRDGSRGGGGRRHRRRAVRIPHPRRRGHAARFGDRGSPLVVDIERPRNRGRGDRGGRVRTSGRRIARGPRPPSQTRPSDSDPRRRVPRIAHNVFARNATSERAPRRFARGWRASSIVANTFVHLRPEAVLLPSQVAVVPALARDNWFIAAAAPDAGRGDGRGRR